MADPSFQRCGVRVRDEVYLDGSVSFSSQSSRSFLLVHGTGGHFAATGILEAFAHDAVASGHSVVRVNTRGHGGPLTGLSETEPVDPAFEDVSDCVDDLSAWINLLNGRGADEVILVGHSMGGVKSVYSQAVRPHEAVTGIVCLSPPRFCHQYWMQHPDADEFRNTYQQAESLVQAGKGDELLNCQQPLKIPLSARSFLAKYGPHDRYDIVELLTRVKVPVLVMIGSATLAASPAFDGLPAQVRRLTDAGHQVEFHMIDGVDMSYRQSPHRPFELTQAWLQNTRVD